MTGRRRRDGDAVLEPHRLREHAELAERAAAHPLEHEPVRDRAERGQRELGEVVRRDREMVRRREVRDPHEAGEPADAAEVGLEHVHGAGAQVARGTGSRCRRSRRSRSAAGPGRAASVPFDVLGMQRLLEPGEVGAGGGERGGVAHRVRQLPHLVCVDAETPVRPDQPPDRRHAGGVLGGILLADLDLDPVEAEREQLLDVGEQLLARRGTGRSRCRRPERRRGSRRAAGAAAVRRACRRDPTAPCRPRRAPAARARCRCGGAACRASPSAGRSRAGPRPRACGRSSRRRARRSRCRRPRSCRRGPFRRGRCPSRRR